MDSHVWTITQPLSPSDTYFTSARGLKTWSSRTVLAAIAALFIMTTATWAIDIRILLNELRIYIPSLFLPDDGTGSSVRYPGALNGPYYAAENTMQDIIVSPTTTWSEQTLNKN